MFPSLFNPKQLAVRVLNAMLSREPWALERVAAHAGKIVRLNVSKYTIRLSIQADGSVVLADEEQSPNVTLTINDESLKQLPSAISQKASIDDLASLLHIEGDAGLARLVSELARDLRWDIEGELSQLVGPFMATMIMSTLRKAKQAGQDLGARGTANVTEFLSHEGKVLVPAVMMRGLSDDIQESLSQLEQLELRIKRLQAKGPAKVASSSAARGAVNNGAMGVAKGAAKGTQSS